MLHLKNDVILLTEFFQEYVDTCKSALGFDPLSSFSTPSFTRKSGLKMTGLKVDYITDVKLSLLLENKKRVGPSSVLGNRHVKL